MHIQNRAGQQFGHYKLIRLIGKGGFAEVYLAEHIHLRVRCALKILIGANLKDDQREEFKAEARTIANLQRLSTHIVQISDFGIEPDPEGKHNGIPYFVMEY